MVEVEKTSMGHERAPRDGWKRQYGISHSVTTIELMAQRVLEDLITAQLEIHTARIVVEFRPGVVTVYVQDMTEEESARIVPILQKYVPETFGWTTTMT
jgi:hypothetical protein